MAHSGELFGYDALVTIYPDMDLGIYTAFNGPGGEAAFIGNQLLHYFIADSMLELTPWLNSSTIQSFPEPWKKKEVYFIPRSNCPIPRNITATRSLHDYSGSYSHGFLGEMSINVDIGRNVLCLLYGKIGKFFLHPNGEEDEFQMEGVDTLSFLQTLDNYAPCTWMMVHFRHSDCNVIDGFVCSLFESGPFFSKL